ncbi:MAG: hypothetical protein ACKO1M_14170 [Planctomycetota bacterium]
MSPERRIILVGVAVLLAVLAVAAAGCLALLGGDVDRVQAVAFAAAVAGGGAVTGWIVSRQGRGRPAAVAVAGGLAATLVRLLPLLAALAWLVGRDQSSWAGTAGGLLVAFHLVLLVTDMVLNSLADRWAGEAFRSAENRPSAGADITN